MNHLLECRLKTTKKALEIEQLKGGLCCKA
jgi:hypothetical protein